MSTLRVSTVVLFVVCLLSINVALVLPAFHDSKAGHALRRAAFDAPAEQPAELRARARAVSRAEQRWIFGAGVLMAAVSAALLGWRIYRCGGVGAAVWQVHSVLPPKL
jgi:hypothetical protein